jgi:hypothetical protein
MWKREGRRINLFPELEARVIYDDANFLGFFWVFWKLLLTLRYTHGPRLAQGSPSSSNEHGSECTIKVIRVICDHRLLDASRDYSLLDPGIRAEYRVVSERLARPGRPEVVIRPSLAQLQSKPRYES